MYIKTHFSVSSYPQCTALFHIIQNQKLENFKDLSKVKPGFKSVPLKFYSEIAGLASAKKWREIQNMAGEERF